jgi:NAD(P)-dependent dehydrogenase (short-subunit alcohol dehydrogenase family)
MTSEPDDLLIVTGGASGIGLATARRFAADGYRVVVLDRDAAALDALGTPSPAHDDRITGIACDVSSRDSVQAAIDEIVSTIGTPTVLVNSAGIYRPAHALDITDADFDALFAVNVRGTFLTSQITARAMAAARGGAIVNVSSVAASESTAENVAYSATKGAVSSLTRAMAVSLAPHNIRVNAVAPGPIDTPMGLAATADPDYEQRMLGRVLAKRFATPEDVATAIRFLADPGSSYVTGHVLPVDGGILAHR